MRLRLTFSIVAIASVLCCAGAVSARTRPATTRVSGVSVLLQRINAERRARREALLRLDDRLCRLAAAHAFDMIEHAYLSHYSQDGRSPFVRMHDAGYPFQYAGENLALDANAEAIAVDFWNSPEHRRNILLPQYRNVGIAAIPRPDGELVVVEDFSD